MKKKKSTPLTRKNGEVRTLTRADMRAFQPAAEALPALLGNEMADALLKRKPGQRGRQKKPVKQLVSVRLDAEILAYFKKGGPGWQSRLNETLLHSIH